MPTLTINALRLLVEASGDGPTVILVHGSWSDHHSWDALVPELGGSRRAIRYDRRGHSDSECPPGQGRIEDDVADLGGVVEAVAGGPSHVVGNSLGAEIALRLAIRRPELVRSLALHEPGFWSLAADDPAVIAILAAIRPAVALLGDGAWEAGARAFADRLFGAGAWDHGMPEPFKRVMVANAATFLDEERAADNGTVDASRLAEVAMPVLLSSGDESDPAFHAVVDRLSAALPHAQRATMRGAGHIPHRTHPADYAALLTPFWAAADQALPALESTSSCARRISTPPGAAPLVSPRPSATRRPIVSSTRVQ